MPEQDSTFSDQLLASVLIPVRNEEKYIGKCLESVLANDLPHTWYEILVADGDSEDRSREIVSEIAARHPSIQLLRNPGRVAPTALNLCLARARGRFIIRLDAHSEYPANYLRNCIEELERTGAANVGGRWITMPGSDSLTAKAVALMTQTRAAVGNASYRLGGGDAYVDTVPFGAFRREIFDEVGWFREDLVRHQDYEFNARIRHAGGRIFLSSKISITYYNVPTFQKFMRQGFQNGVWAARAWIRYPVCFCWRHAAPLGFVAALLLPLLGSLFFPKLLWVLAAEVAGYFGISFVSASQVARVHGWKYLAVIPALMFAYHFVYGFGSIVGLITGRVKQASSPGQLKTA